MKKVLSLFLVIFVSFFFGSCAKKKIEKPKQQPAKIQNQKWKNEFQNAPVWVLNPPNGKQLAAVGSAKIGKAGIQFARTEALANARDELARMLSVKVKNMVKNFSQQIGVGEDQTVDKVTAIVSKQVTAQLLQGSMQKDMWISPSGELYVLVVLDPQAVKEAVKQATLASFKNERALWQQFQAKKAYEELDKEIEKEFGSQ
ncbi:LPP20 family lipoprotein [Hydrogenothermus marinus]|uniref:LPP20 lipoprotein n=1 Tax=Hydrogenothermus marinus TaxID=133270 RepID=A0A3M0BD94_9AQUI|nr:LPP20 family lipoprotein [Hydrogenothermus marinus]RMA92535.1 LPP20 lipoprotein [Hydrogenothermus marinus]